MSTYYEILGVPPDAAPAAIKQAYRQRAKLWHPDLNNGSQKHEEQFKLLQTAYETLVDTTQRTEYDASLRSHTDIEQEEEEIDYTTGQTEVYYDNSHTIETVNNEIKGYRRVAIAFLLLLVFVMGLLYFNYNGTAILVFVMGLPSMIMLYEWSSATK